MVETIYGCKWSLTVYRLLANGINRPGEMVRSVEGLTTKVLNECLRKNMAFGIIARITYNESPPRVEYAVTPSAGNSSAFWMHSSSCKTRSSQKHERWDGGERGSTRPYVHVRPSSLRHPERASGSAGSAT
ncbi:MAG: helix-turn-helix transcriptional regulator [Nitrospira sp.]|nr:helix-turn-helix transcriptional regulator [Nitrospira sp.]